MTISRQIASLCLAGLAVGSAATAQVRSSAYYLGYGTADFGGSVLATGYSRRLDLNPGVELATGNSLVQRVRAFGRDVEAAAVLANYSVRKVSSGVPFPLWRQSATGSFVRRVAGLSWSLSATSNATIAAVCAPGLAFGTSGVSHQADVFGLAIGVRVNASVGLTYSLTPTLTFDPDLIVLNLPSPPRLTAGLSGQARGSAVGSASAWVAVPVPLAVYGAGVSANLVFADTRMDLSAIATTSSQGGAFTVSVRPIDMQLDAVARITTALGTVEQRQPIVSWRSGSIHQSFPLQ